MADGSIVQAAPAAEELERFTDLAGRLDPVQRQALAGVLEAARIFDDHGDQDGLDQLLEDAPALLQVAD